MKKFLIMSVLALVVLSACSSNDSGGDPKTTVLCSSTNTLGYGDINTQTLIAQGDDLLSQEIKTEIDFTALEEDLANSLREVLRVSIERVEAEQEGIMGITNEYTLTEEKFVERNIFDFKLANMQDLVDLGIVTPGEGTTGLPKSVSLEATQHSLEEYGYTCQVQ